MLTGIEHVQVDYARDRYAGHPRQGGIFNFGNGEVAVLYNRAPCRYQQAKDVWHDHYGYHSRSQVILARSFDGGVTWDRQNDVVVFDQTRPYAERLAFVRQTELDPDIDREEIDLNSPDTAIFFGRMWGGEHNPSEMISFVVRSADRGRTWEDVPTPLSAPSKRGSVFKDGHPLVTMPDGTHLGSMSTAVGVCLYGSDDHGLNWEPIALICNDPTEFGRTTYAGLILLPTGRLQCYTLNLGGLRDAIQMNYSDDGGYSWSLPKPVIKWGQSPWVHRRSAGKKWQRTHAFGKYYRSPWPLRLSDGRIVVIFGRRRPPIGIGVIVSEDDGQTWSTEQILRDDASVADMSYPVATELEPGLIFAAYYFTLDDGNGQGGTRFIAGSRFRI